MATKRKHDDAPPSTSENGAVPTKPQRAVNPGTENYPRKRIAIAVSESTRYIASQCVLTDLSAMCVGFERRDAMLESHLVASALTWASSAHIEHPRLATGMHFSFHMVLR